MNAIERQLLRSDRLRSKRALSRALAIILTFLFVAVFIAGVVTLVLPQVVRSINMLVERMPALIDQAAKLMERVDFLEPYAENLRTELGDLSWGLVVTKVASFLRSGAGVLDNVMTTVNSIMSGLTNTVIAFLFLLYLLASKERVGQHSRRLLYSFVKESIADKTMYVFHIVHYNFSAFVSGTVISAIVAGLSTFIVMIILRLPNAVMVSVVIGVASLVPIIGSIVGVTIGTLVVFMVSPLQALVFLIAVIIMMQIEGNIIFPKLLGKVMGLPAMWTLLAISLGGSLLGILGIWFFVPLFSSGYALLAEASAIRLKKKQIDLSEKKGPEVAFNVRMNMGMSEAEAQACSRRKGSPKIVRQGFRQPLEKICAKLSRKKESNEKDQDNDAD